MQTQHSTSEEARGDLSLTCSMPRYTVTVQRELPTAGGAHHLLPSLFIIFVLNHDSDDDNNNNRINASKVQTRRQPARLAPVWTGPSGRRLWTWKWPHSTRPERGAPSCAQMARTPLATNVFFTSNTKLTALWTSTRCVVAKWFTQTQ